MTLYKICVSACRRILKRLIRIRSHKMGFRLIFLDANSQKCTLTIRRECFSFQNVIKLISGSGVALLTNDILTINPKVPEWLSPVIRGCEEGKFGTFHPTVDCDDNHECSRCERHFSLFSHLNYDHLTPSQIDHLQDVHKPPVMHSLCGRGNSLPVGYLCFIHTCSSRKCCVGNNREHPYAVPVRLMWPVKTLTRAVVFDSLRRWFGYPLRYKYGDYISENDLLESLGAKYRLPLMENVFNLLGNKVFLSKRGIRAFRSSLPAPDPCLPRYASLPKSPNKRL